MLTLFEILWISGIILAIVNGLLSGKCYFYLTNGGVETLFKKERPNITKLLKAYRYGDEKINDPKLKWYLNWIFYTKWLGIASFVIGLFVYVAAFI